MQLAIVAAVVLVGAALVGALVLFSQSGETDAGDEAKTTREGSADGWSNEAPKTPVIASAPSVLTSAANKSAPKDDLRLPTEPANVRYKRGETVDLLRNLAKPGDVIKVAGPPPSEFQRTPNGLQKRFAMPDLQASLVPLPLGVRFPKSNWASENYRWTATWKAMRNGAVYFSFPVANKQFVAYVGSGERYVGLAVTPPALSDQVRKDIGIVRADRSHQIEAFVQVIEDVRRARVEVQLNGIQVIHWLAPLDEVEADGALTPSPDQDAFVVFGFGAQQEVQVELQEFKVEMLRKPPPAAGKP
jgi:hypothetical protein